MGVISILYWTLAKAGALILAGPRLKSRGYAKNVRIALVKIYLYIYHKS